MTSITVEKARIQNNLDRIKERIGTADIIAVLKGWAYGLDLHQFADTLRENGVRRFAVTEPSDAVLLRDWGFSEEEILILRSTALEDDITQILSACATATIGSYDAAVALNGIAEAQGITVDVHIKIDTGMGRYGFDPTELDRIISVFRFMSNLNVTGMYTHYANAFRSEKKTKAQYDTFMSVVSKIRDAGFEPGMLHASNSAAVFGCKVPHLDAVRVGSSIGGRVLVRGDFGLQKAGVLESRIAEIRWLPQGHSIGYGSAFTTKKPTKIAIVPVGTCDGFMLEKCRDCFRFRDCFAMIGSAVLSFVRGKRFYITVNGKRARILGHVGSTHTIADVSDIECSAGTVVSFDASPMFIAHSIERHYV